MTVVTAIIPAGMLLVRRPLALQSYGLSARSLFASLAIGGLAGGLLVGLCRPMFRWRAAAIAVGSIVGVLGFGAMGVAMYGLNADSYIIAVPSMIVGGALGNTWWERRIEPTLLRPEFPDPPAKSAPLGRWRP